MARAAVRLRALRTLRPSGERPGAARSPPETGSGTATARARWRRPGDRKFAFELLDALVATPVAAGVERIILPPLPYLGELVQRYGDKGLQFGAQDVSVNQKGAYTGEVSAAMLVDVGARYGLV